MKELVQKKEIPKTKIWKNPIVVLIGFCALFVGLQAVVALLVTPISELLDKNLQLLTFSLLSVVLLYLSLGVIKNRLKSSWQAIGVKLPPAKSLVLVLPALIIYFLFSLIFTSLAIKFISGFDLKQAQDVGFENLKQPLELMVAFLTLVILTPIFEETLFRGVLFKGLRARLPFWVCALVTSLIFAAAHMQLNVAIDTFALSLILCLLVERSSSIVPAILLHSLKNGLAFAILFVIK